MENTRYPNQNSSNLHAEPIQLMLAARNGDSAAFGQLYRLYFTPIYRYVYFRISDKDEVEDLVQSVFVKVFQKIRAFEDQNKSPLAYFYTVARNLVIDYWKKKKPVRLDEESDLIETIPDHREAPDTWVERRMTKDEIATAMTGLSEDQKDVIVHRYLNELSHKEIAVVMGKTDEAVRQLLMRAHAKLRKYFEQYGRKI